MEVLVEGDDDRSPLLRTWDSLTAVMVQVMISTAIGLTIIVMAISLLEHEVKEICIHVGTAFIVAGIVSFGIEWGREVRHARTLTATLVSVLWTYKRDVLTPAVKNSVRNGMFILMGRREQELADEITQLVEHIGQLGDKGGWARKAYLEYLRSLQLQLATQAASLSKMAESSSNDMGAIGADVRIDMPEPVVLADVLVEGALRELLALRHSKNVPDTGEAEYLAVSDIATWRTLDRLSGAHDEATKHLKMRRIFVLGLDSDNQLSAEHVYEVIARHCADTRNSQYEVRLIMLERYRSTPLLELIEAKHFGIFKPPPSAGSAIAVIARDSEISKLRLTTVTNEMLSEFDTLWARAEPANVTRSWRGARHAHVGESVRAQEVVIDDFLMAYFIMRMPRDGHYRGISHLSDWLDGHYREFFKASAKSFIRKGVRAQRIFIRNVPMDDDRVVELLSQHERQYVETDGRYDWRLCEAALVDGEIAKEEPICLFDSASDEDPSRVIIDRARPKREWKQTTAEENRILSTSFDRLWKKCGDVRDTIKQIIPSRASEIFTDKSDARPGPASIRPQ